MSEQRRMTFSLTLVNRCNNSRRFKDFSDFWLWFNGRGTRRTFLSAHFSDSNCVYFESLETREKFPCYRSRQSIWTASSEKSRINLFSLWNFSRAWLSHLQLWNVEIFVVLFTLVQLHAFVSRELMIETHIQLSSMLFVCLIFHPRLSHRCVERERACSRLLFMFHLITYSVSEGMKSVNLK